MGVCTPIEAGKNYLVVDLAARHVVVAKLKPKIMNINHALAIK